jgi:predicted nucleotidyltransferase
MKFETLGQYPVSATSDALAAFLTVWPSLQQYHREMVLVGGLVPELICTHPSAGANLPRPKTMDVDLGISLGTSGGLYGTLSSALQSIGFLESEKERGRYTRKHDGVDLYVDFLAEQEGKSGGGAMVDDVMASVFHGIDRALETAKEISVEGLDLFGAKQSVVARVCDIGPYIALKLCAFHSRQSPKDAYDIVYAVTNYDGGIEAALDGFAKEVNAGNTACPHALKCLDKDFATENSPGPVRACHFLYGSTGRKDAGDVQLQRELLSQRAVNVAQKLLRAAR